MKDDALWRTEDTSAWSGLAIRTLERFRLEGGGPAFVQLGRSVRYRPEDVRRWAEERRVLAKGRGLGNWIRVEDEMPKAEDMISQVDEHGEREGGFLVYCGPGSPYFLASIGEDYSTKESCFFHLGGDRQGVMIFGVTHWARLPDPPA